MQELRRYSQSDKLDLAPRNPDKIKVFTELIVNDIKEHMSSQYAKRDWFEQRIQRYLDISESEAAVWFRDLSDSGHLKMICNSLQLFSLSDSVVDPFNIAQDCLLHDKFGNRIGFYSGNMFLYEIGAIDEVPITICIYSNNESANKYSELRICNKRFKYKQIEIAINETNYSVLQILLWAGSKLFSRDELIVSHIKRYMYDHNIRLIDFEQYSQSFSEVAQKRVIEVLFR